MITEHWTDADGNPAGGTASGTGYCISWQHGVLANWQTPQNGAFIEDVLMAARDRLLHHQTTRFRCDDNDSAIQHIEEALAALARRTHDRKQRGVEGTHEL